jgi:hypothetical protein
MESSGSYIVNSQPTFESTNVKADADTEGDENWNISIYLKKFCATRTNSISSSSCGHDDKKSPSFAPEIAGRPVTQTPPGPTSSLDIDYHGDPCDRMYIVVVCNRNALGDRRADRGVGRAS